MRRLLFVAAGIGAAVFGGTAYWRRNRRVGTRFVNEAINPLLLRWRLAGAGRSEIGTVEHVGRRSGIIRLTPVHPEVMPDEVRIIVPLGGSSEWARNVLVAGHCRLQLRDVVYELDEPRFVSAETLPDLPRAFRLVAGWLGFMYLRLHRFGDHPGSLDAPTTAAAFSDGEAAPAISADVAAEELVAPGV
jgi:hypothetical protein